MLSLLACLSRATQPAERLLAPAAIRTRSIMARGAAPRADPVSERRLLRGVLDEALLNQERKRAALEEQLESSRPIDLSGAEAEGKAAEKERRRAAAVPQHLRIVEEMSSTLTLLRTKLSGLEPDSLAEVRHVMETELALAARLASFDVDAHARAQWGRPDGFDGLVVESPLGTPILVARRSFNDEHLRRISRGPDLFFQVREGRGSRVLLRTSMCRSLKRSRRECMEAASDLAAYFSDSRPPTRVLVADPGRRVEVMFTDSRHVAKRGGRVGQLKDKKKLGTVMACPARALTVARAAQEEQGCWL